MDESARYPKLITRSDRWWLAGFAASVMLLWLMVFSWTLFPSWDPFPLLLVPVYVLALTCLFVIFTSPYFSPRNDRRRKQWWCRLGLIAGCISFYWAAFAIAGGPVLIGILCGAKRTVGLQAVRELHGSVAAGLTVSDVMPRNLDASEMPASLRSSLWGSPRFVAVTPRVAGPPGLTISWGGGFRTWGIVVEPGGESAINTADRDVAHWEDDVFVFSGY